MNLKSTRSGFGDCLVELGSEQDNIVVITADLRSSTKVKEFAQNSLKVLRCGVAEQNLACCSWVSLVRKKFCSFFCLFLSCFNWAQIRQSICYNGLMLILALVGWQQVLMAQPINLWKILL